MDKQLQIAVVGATGLVGETLVELLEQRNFPFSKLYLLAASEVAGKRVPFMGHNLIVESLEHFDFSQVQLAFFCAPEEVAAQYAPKALAAGCGVIDNSAAFRQQADTPLVIPGVNDSALDGLQWPAIVASPEAATVAMLVALQPVHAAFGVTHIDVVSLQPVSGAGRAAVAALAGQTARLLNAQPIEDGVFGRQMAFNLLPQIEETQHNGYTRKENFIVSETRKILQDPKLVVNPTAVRVSVFYGVSEAVTLQTREPVSPDAVAALLRQQAGIAYFEPKPESPGPTPVTDVAGDDRVFVARLRQPEGQPHSLSLWAATDNTRKGGALNSVHIGEILVKDYL